MGAKTVNGPSERSASASPAACTAVTSVWNFAATAVSTMLGLPRPSKKERPRTAPFGGDWAPATVTMPDMRHMAATLAVTRRSEREGRRCRDPDMMTVILCSSDPPSPMVHAWSGVRNADPANDSAAATRQAPYSRGEAPHVRMTSASHASSSDDLSPRRAIHASGFHHSHATTAQSSQRTRWSRRRMCASSCISMRRRFGSLASASRVSGITMTGPRSPLHTNGTASARVVSTATVRRMPSSSATEWAMPRIPCPAG